MADPHPTLSISAVSRRTGIPVSTLRFYEKELPGLFHIRKTRGGHRRYGEEDVARFVTVRRLTESEGLGLADVRRVLMSRGDAEALRVEVDRVRETGAADGQAVARSGAPGRGARGSNRGHRSRPVKKGWLRRTP